MEGEPPVRNGTASRRVAQQPMSTYQGQEITGHQAGIQLPKSTRPGRRTLPTKKTAITPPAMATTFIRSHPRRDESIPSRKIPSREP